MGIIWKRISIDSVVHIYLFSVQYKREVFAMRLKKILRQKPGFLRGAYNIICVYIYIYIGKRKYMLANEDLPATNQLDVRDR